MEENKNALSTVSTNVDSSVTGISSYYYETETVDDSDEDTSNENISLINENKITKKMKHVQQRQIKSYGDEVATKVKNACLSCGNSSWLELVIWGVLILGISVVVVALVLKQNTNFGPEDEACEVYCDSPLLEAVSKYKLFNDSKTFVDMPMKMPPKEINNAFKKLQNLNAHSMQVFIDEHFRPVGSDQEEWIPEDFPLRPQFYDNMNNETMKEFILNVHRIWKLLGRKVPANVSTLQAQNSLIYLPHPYIVPGGRFREVYYWDTFWIIKGLLQSGLDGVVRGIIYNYFHLIDRFGFIPNGNRVYYLTRSQPPLLNEMVMALFEATGNKTDLVVALPYLEKEYKYWNETGEGKQAQFDSILLSKYNAVTTLPRPESYREDTETASKAGMDDQQRVQFYKDVATGAETGWDFSSRWFQDKRHLFSIRTSSIVPVDLNVFMLRFESHLATITTKVGNDPSKAATYRSAMYARGAAMVTMMFNVSTCTFHDIVFPSGEQIASISASNYFPLWAGKIFDDGVQSCMMLALEKSPMMKKGGFDTTNSNTGQQWDSPNAWAPVQWILAQGLDAIGTVEGRKLALKIKCNWLQTTMLAYKKTSFMYEKYNATKVGEGGGGGEYTPQLGFGWTNGVVLDFMADIAGSYDILCLG
eukprot:m.2767 g.2767  ORF g.2767 m.2767 type:complete len:646 (+) comp1930_c0_seq1:102-2039(+)